MFVWVCAGGFCALVAYGVFCDVRRSLLMQRAKRRGEAAVQRGREIVADGEWLRWELDHFRRELAFASTEQDLESLRFFDPEDWQ